MDTLPEVSLSRPQEAYRRRRISSTSMQPPAITDADDSIVLSDLVRTGEASRLRRRGAMRLDRNSVHSFWPHPESDSDEENRPYSFVYGQSDMMDRRHRAFAAHHRGSDYDSFDFERVPESHSAHYILACGAAVESAPESFSPAPFATSILPVAKSSTRNRGRHLTSNGCGAIIHFAASPSPASPHSPAVYTAKSPATDLVVSLEPEYFHPHVGLRFETSPCGCVKEGIGCASCGNSLGTRWKFCERMAEGRRKGEPESRSEDLELYTFFSSAVTAFPDPTSSFGPVHLLSRRHQNKDTTQVELVPTEPNTPESNANSPVFAPSSSHSRPRPPPMRRSTLSWGTALPREWSDYVPSATSSLPIFDRQFTSSPEPMDPSNPEGQTQEEQPFEALMSTLRQAAPPNRRQPPQQQPQSNHHSADPSAEAAAAARRAHRDRTLSVSPRRSFPLPRRMSFYRQQVLGAWEREREREVQSHAADATNERGPQDIQLSRTVIVHPRQPLEPLPVVSTAPFEPPSLSESHLQTPPFEVYDFTTGWMVWGSPAYNTPWSVNGGRDITTGGSSEVPLELSATGLPTSRPCADVDLDGDGEWVAGDEECEHLGAPVGMVFDR